MRRVIGCVVGGTVPFLAALPSFSAEPDVAAMLRRNDVTALDKLLNDVQARFEQGQASEIELRNAFRPFYDPDEVSVRNLHEWAASHPRSYAARLADGIYFKRRGLAARGENYISKTSQAALDEMERHFAKAKIELAASRSLTRKPYLTLFHLLDIANVEGNRDASVTLLQAANHLLPDNHLARNRFAVSLMPRWGGSYPDVEQFIAKCQREGLDQNGVMQLQAIMHDDQGHTLQERRDVDGARKQFIQALELGQKVGGSFSQDFLGVSRYYVCSTGGTPSSQYC